MVFLGGVPSTTGPLLYFSLSVVVCVLLAVLRTLLEGGYVDCYAHLVRHVAEHFPFIYIVLILSCFIIWRVYPR
jgi:hypothetical protein